MLFLFNNDVIANMGHLFNRLILYLQRDGGALAFAVGTSSMRGGSN